MVWPTLGQARLKNRTEKNRSISLDNITFTPSVQLPQLFATPFLTQSVLPIHSNLFGATSEHLFQAAFNTL